MQAVAKLPEDLTSSLTALESDKVLCEALGPELSACCLAVKRKEVQAVKANDLAILMDRF
jgi:glutamine synthetase